MSFSSKAARKTRRVVEKVKQECGINLLEPENASKHLLLCNAGLMNGVTPEALAELLLEFCNSLPSIVLLPGKSYSFLSFDSAAEAAEVYTRVHGKVGLELDVGGGPLYLAFVDQVPKSREDLWTIWSGTLPKGLLLIENFVNEEEETAILSSLTFDVSPKSGLKYRQVYHFGFDFVYGSNSIDSDRPNGKELPESCKAMLGRALGSGHIKVLPDQCTVNKYEPGQGIPPHIDTHSCCDDTITSLSLGSDTVMNFVHPEGKSLAVILPRRSLLVMRDEARYLYSHGIATRSSDIVPLDKEYNRFRKAEEKSVPRSGWTLKKRGQRVSLTFRKTLCGPCSCQYPAQCDSQKSKTVKLDHLMAKSLEDTHVHSVYEEIADHFSTTRHKPWPRVLDFITSLPENGFVFDVGCGNGKYLGHHKNQVQIGCDYSNGLVSICRQRGFNGIRCDCLYLPFRSDCADGIICIAVIHHLSTEERRLQAVQEIGRVLRPGGRCLIYAWAKEQVKDQKTSSYMKKKRQISEQKAAPSERTNDFPVSLPVHINRTNFQHSDLLVPWTKKGEEQKTFHRFYHVFLEGELEVLVRNVKTLIIEESYYDQGNWCVILKKCSS